MKILFDFKVAQDNIGNILHLGYEDKKYVQGKIGGKSFEINLYVPPSTTLDEFVGHVGSGIEKLNDHIAKNL